MSYFINITNCTINLTFWMRNIVRGCCTWKRRSGRRPVKIKFTADMWLQILSTVVCVHWLQLQLGGVKAGRAPIPVIADTGAGTCNIARDIASPTPRHTCHTPRRTDLLQPRQPAGGPLDVDEAHQHRHQVVGGPQQPRGQEVVGGAACTVSLYSYTLELEMKAI